MALEIGHGGVIYFAVRGCGGLLTSARRAEVFGATAAYAAVLVVYVSGSLGPSNGSAGG